MLGPPPIGAMLSAVARSLLGASRLALLIVTASASAFAQATPPSPFRAPEPAKAPINLDEPATPAPPAMIATDEKPPDPKETPVQRARRNVVVLVRGGKALGLGSVLAGDGRILTALSPLGHGNNVEARYADGKLVPVRVVHSDRAWDLALVTPTTSRADGGLRASRANAGTKGAKLTSFSPGGKDVANVGVKVKEEKTLVGGDGAELAGALVLESKHKAQELGSPVIDEKGDVIAVLAQACAPVADKPCSMAPYAAPVGAIKTFLRGVPASAEPAAPALPLGVRAVAHDSGPAKGVRVISVAARSPARFALRPGDIVVAVNGTPVASPEDFAQAVRVRGRVQLLVYSGGRYREVSVGAGARAGEGRGFRRIDPMKRLPWRRPRPRPRPDDAGF